MATMGMQRRKDGRFGCHNNGCRDLFGGFNFKVSQLLKIIIESLFGWILLEIREGWKSWFRSPESSTTAIDAVPEFAGTMN